MKHSLFTTTEIQIGLVIFIMCRINHFVSCDATIRKNVNFLTDTNIIRNGVSRYLKCNNVPKNIDKSR